MYKKLQLHILLNFQSTYFKLFMQEENALKIYCVNTFK